jgi:formate dehydrogenase iron-sulfur subunit
MPDPVGFFTDSSVCIGCKACEVACKEWNQLEGNTPSWGDGFDNTKKLDAENWRHVKFIDQVPEGEMLTGNGAAWLMMSDVCKHCKNAACMEVCPTDAIVRTEYDTVYIQPSSCNGCRDCISACPFGVIGFSSKTGVAQKCTLCYDRLQSNMEPACAKVCPTQSIQFGSLTDLHAKADARLATLKAQGNDKAQLYGRDDSIYGGLNSFFLLMDKPETYGLPNAQNAVLPRRNNFASYLAAFVTAAVGVFVGVKALGGSSPSTGESTGGTV